MGVGEVVIGCVNAHVHGNHMLPAPSSPLTCDQALIENAVVSPRKQLLYHNGDGDSLVGIVAIVEGWTPDAGRALVSAQCKHKWPLIMAHT